MDSAGGPSDLGELVGTILAGRYRIERRLGSGGMGAVYLGEHLRMGRRDAIKVMRAEMARDPEAIARFTRGARAVAQVQHPHVCQLYDFGEAEGGILFLAMEFIDGPSLSQLLAEEGRLRPDRAIRFIQQAGEALHAAHGVGIVHRDLKPDNLMVARAKDGSEHLKVVDFDIARGTEVEGAGVTRQGFVVGTPEYMSPEQLTGDHLDARSDIYSLALVLFRALSGRLPFEGTTAQELMMQRLSTAPLRLSQAAPGRTFPKGLEEVIDAALSKLPDERPASAREFVRQVVACEEGGAAPARPEPDDATRVAPAAAWAPAATGAAIPGTQVSDGGSSPAGGPAGRGRKAVLLGGGTVGVVVMVLLAWQMLPAGGDSAAPGESPAIGDSIEAVALQPPGESGDPGSGPLALEGEQAAERPSVRPESPRSEVSGSGDSPAPRSETGSEAESTPVAGARPVTLMPGDPRALQRITFDQYVLQAEARNRAELLAARDTAAAVWAVPSATRPDRAFAAHVLGLALVSLGDTVQGIEWLEEAVRLDPLDRYSTALEAYRRPER